MSLPSVTPSEEVQIANVSTSTHSQQTSSATSAASSTPSNTATSTAASSTTSTATLPPITPSPTNEVVNVEPPTEPVPNRVIITFTSDVNAEEQAEYIESIGGNITQSIDSLNAVVVEIPEAATELPLAPVVSVAEPDYYVSALVSVPPSDVYYPQQWALPV